MEKEIYLAGGCYWGVEKFVSCIQGVLHTTVGFANGSVYAPSYDQVCHENTGHAETVRVCYDEEKLPLSTLLALFFRIIDPLAVDRQGGDVGHQYRTGIFYTEERDRSIVESCVADLAKQYSEPLALEVKPLENFWPAEEYHQKYLDKNPTGYCHVPLEMIRWIQEADPDDYLKK